MRSMIYTSTGGADNLLHMQTLHANNLANVSTIGFKSDFYKLTSVQASENKNNSTFQPKSQGIYSDFSSGSAIQTQRELDLAIQGPGWFVVKVDESEVYSRNGNFKIDENGLLTDMRNRPIMGNGGEITIPENHKIEVGSDGTISAISLTGSNMQPIIIDRIKLVNPEETNLVKDKHGFFRTRDRSSPDPDLTVRLNSGMLETSNVNPIKELAKMISLARQYEIQMKTISAAEENEKLSANILNT